MDHPTNGVPVTETLDKLYLEIAPITQARSQRDLELFHAMDAALHTWEEGGDMHTAMDNLRDVLHRHAIPVAGNLLTSPEPPAPASAQLPLGLPPAEGSGPGLDFERGPRQGHAKDLYGDSFALVEGSENTEDGGPTLWLGAHRPGDPRVAKSLFSRRQVGDLVRELQGWLQTGRLPEGA